MHKTLLVLLLSSACATAGADLDVDQSSVVLGGNDLVRVARDGSNIPARYRGVIDAIGQMQPMGCTVTHVGNGIAITAGHCFGPARGRQENLSCDASIQWGYRGSDDNASAYLTSHCVKILSIEFAEKKTDFAIIQVSPVPPVQIGVAFTRPARGQQLTIFSHPHRNPLEWSGVCARGDSTDSVFHHDCDTDHGSSGAAVLDDSRLIVIGIHNGGDAVNGYNYGTYLADTPLALYLDGGGNPGGGGDPGSGSGSGSANDDLSSPELFAFSMHAGEWRDFGPYNVSSSSTFQATTVGWGDIDLFVRRGQATDGVTSDCSSRTPMTGEHCSVHGPGPMFVSIYSFAESSFDLDTQ